jgi:6-phosphogluconolactonase
MLPRQQGGDHRKGIDRMSRTPAWAPLLLALLATTACGGGGSGTSAPPASYSVGGTVSGLSGTGLTLKNGGDTITVSANGTFTFPTQVAGGASYAVAVGTQPGSPAQICTVSNGSGTIAAANVTAVAVACRAAPAGYVYISQPGSSLGPADGTLLALAIDATTGALSQVGTVTAPGGASTITASRSNRELILARGDFRSTTHPDWGPLVQRYRIDGATGRLAYDSQITTDSQTLSLFTHPDGVGLYGVGSGVTYYSLAAGTAATPLALPGSGEGVIDPAGKYIYVSSGPSDRFANYGIISVSLANPAQPVASSQLAVDDRLYRTAIHPGGRYLYATSLSEASVALFDLGSDGVVTRGASYPAPRGARGIFVAPSGNFLYLADADGDQLIRYRLDANGVPSDPVSIAMPDPLMFATDPDGRFLYVLTFGPSGGPASIYAYAIGGDGLLTPLSGSPYPAGETSRSMAVAKYVP